LPRKASSRKAGSRRRKRETSSSPDDGDSRDEWEGFFEAKGRRKRKGKPKGEVHAANPPGRDQVPFFSYLLC
jgi:hypothetical protein